MVEEEQFGNHRGNQREHSGFLKNDSDDFKETPGNRGNLQEGFPKVN
jgi:hypothetical protein